MTLKWCAPPPLSFLASLTCLRDADTVSRRYSK